MSESRVEPRLTIGVPVYNTAAYIGDALESLLAQTYRDFRIVISDNASTDETPKICKAFAAADDRIDYERHEVNRGAAWNFNRVFLRAKSEYFKWASADDVCHPEMIARCIEVLDAEPDVVNCHTYSQKIDAKGQVLHQLGDPTRPHLHTDAAEHEASGQDPATRFRDVLLSTGWGVRSYGVIRREALAATTLIQPCYGWEKITMAELALIGRMKLFPDVLFSLRVHAEASSNILSQEELAKFFAPQNVGSSRWDRLRLLGGFLRAPWRHRLSLVDRLRCQAAVAGYLFQPRKWPKLLKKFLGRKGVGNAGIELNSTEKSTTTTN